MANPFEWIGQVSGLISGQQSVGEFAWFWNILTIISSIIFYGVLMVALYFGVTKLMQYRLPVQIYRMKANGSTVIYQDKAKIIKDPKNKNILELKKTKVGRERLKFPQPSSRHTYTTKKGKDVYVLFLDDNKQCHPVELGIKTKLKGVYNKEAKQEVRDNVLENAKLMSGIVSTSSMEEPDKERKKYMKIIPQDQRSWAREMDKRVDEKLQKQDKFFRWAMIGAPLGGLAIIAFMMYFATQNAGATCAAASSSFQSVCEEMTKACIGS